MYIDFLTIAVAVMIIVTVLMQILATRRVHHNPSFAPEQRRAQLWLIWLLPIIGASVVLAILSDEPVVEKDRQSQRNT